MTDPSSQPSDVPPAGNYLYRSVDAPTDHSCFEPFAAIAPDETDLVLITRSPNEAKKHWQQVHDVPPADVHIVSISDQTRSVATQDSAAGTPTSDDIWTVSHPGDLTGIGIAITEILSELTDSDCRILVCFEALDAVLQYAAVKPAYRFLHQVTTEFDQVDALAHFHVADYQFDGGPANRIRSLFDGVIECDGDGTRHRTDTQEEGD